MRDQYAGDISDLLKFAFLRALAEQDRTLGIAWYYAPGDDKRADGRHVEWRDDPAWRALDVELYAGLSALPERSIVALQNAPIWPSGTIFHREPMPPLNERVAWAARKRSDLDQADIIFLDPDNGLGNQTEKHATYSEIKLLRRPRRAVVVISFPGRRPHAALLHELHERLRVEADVQEVVTLRTNVPIPSKRPGSFVPRSRWFTLIDPDAQLTTRAREFTTRLGAVPRVTASLNGTI